MMPRSYRLKTNVEAVVWNPNDMESCGAVIAWSNFECYINEDKSVDVPTLMGPVRACPGDVIFRMAKGQLFVCSADLFHLLYEEI